MLARLGGSAVNAYRRVCCFAGPHGNAKKLDGAISSVVFNAEGLEGVNRDLEARFLETERSLLQMNDLAGRLLGESEQLLKYVTGQSGGAETLRAGFDVLGAPLDFVEASRARTDRLMETLRHQERQMDAMRRHETALGNAVAPLKYIQTMFRIESARLPADMQGIFLGLTKEIEGLHRRVGEIFGEQFRRLAQSREAIEVLIRRIETQAERHQETAARKRSQVRQTLGDLQSEMNEGEKADMTLVRTSRGISEQVAKIIVAMQFQDIVRQKVEHVREGLSDMSNHRPCDIRTSGKDFRRNVLYQRDASRLQRNQLRGVLADISGAQAQYVAALGEIRQMAGDLDGECGRLAGFRSVSAAADGMVPALLSAVGDMKELVAAISESLAETHKTLEPLGGLAANLTGVMRELSSHIKLIALNAQIQASQVGTGTGLEILSENTTRISDDIYHLNETAASELDLLISGLNAAIRESSAMQEEASQVRDGLNARCSELEARLHAYRESVREVFEAVKATSKTLSSETSKAIDGSDFTALASGRVESVIGSLDSVSEVAAEMLRYSEEADMNGLEVLKHLNRNYTMESERAVHAAALSGSDGVGTETVPTGSVDLFGEEPPVVVRTAPPAPQSNKSATDTPDVELF